MNASTLSYEDVVGRVRAVWADVLGGDSIEDIPLDVNFLELGGNSLLLVMLWEELQPIASRPLKLSELFHHGTVQAQAELLTAEPAEPKPAEQGPPGPKSTEPGPAEPDQTEPGPTDLRSPRSLLAQRRAAVSGGGAG